MKYEYTLREQLLVLTVVIIIVLIISLGVILPKQLVPIYEKNIYSYLKQPLNLIENDINSTSIDSEAAYLYINSNNEIVISHNFYDLIDIDIENFLDKIDYNYGKFRYKNKTYYYNTSKGINVTKIAFTNDNYIKSMRYSIFNTIFYTVGITYLVVTIILLYWSNSLVSKINKLKEKVDNINNENYKYEKLKEDDALYSLDNAINKMRLYLKENEEYKNQMYQNISHDFKTPITVMKSYIEAYDDKVLSEEKTMSVIKEQINKLEIKVHSLLYLNKINYIKDKNQKLSDTYDVGLILTSSLEKFKMARPDVNFKINIDAKNTVFRGSKDMWEAIIDNIMGNFIRYANKEISITLKNNKIIFYNDGPNIDNNILNNIFTPYERGINGMFGLGLSIVKKTLQLLDYDIFVKNEKKGIKFIIVKKK